MKKTIPILTALFCAIILFFTLYGEKLYYATKPDVTAYRASMLWSDESGNKRLVIPRECVLEGNYVYTLNQTTGFSLTINTVSKREVEISPYIFDDSMVAIERGLDQGDMLVYHSEEELKDGMRVNIIGEAW